MNKINEVIDKIYKNQKYVFYVFIILMVLVATYKIIEEKTNIIKQEDYKGHIVFNQFSKEKIIEIKNKIQIMAKSHGMELQDLEIREYEDKTVQWSYNYTLLNKTKINFIDSQINNIINEELRKGK